MPQLSANAFAPATSCLTNSFWLMAAALAICGFTWGVAQVIWGTLL
jgi:hypothetical protein